MIDALPPLMLTLGFGEYLPFAIAMPLLLVASGFASGSETALFSLSPGDRARLRRASPASARAVENLLAHPRQLLLFVLLLNMLANISYFVASSLLTARAETAVAQLALSVASVITIILFGEVLAKMLARTHRVTACRLIGPLLFGLRTILDPLLKTTDRWVIAPLSRLVSGGAKADASESIAAQLRELVAADSGQLDEVEQRLLAAVVDLRDARCAEVMTPRQDLPTVTIGASRGDVIDAVRTSRRVLLPVVDNSPAAHVVGLLRVKPYLASTETSAGAIVRHTIRPLFIPETARLDVALEQLRQAGRSLAICVDEHGDFAGVLEIEDVVDELLEGIGEDRAPEIRRVEMVGLGEWLVPGALRLRELADVFAETSAPPAVERFAAGRVRTVAGLVVHTLGRVPQEGDRIEAMGLELVVESIESRRVVTVRVRIAGAQPEGPR